MKKADGPNWQLIITIALVVFIVIAILFIFFLKGSLGEGTNIIRGLL